MFKSCYALPAKSRLPEACQLTAIILSSDLLKRNLESKQLRAINRAIAFEKPYTYLLHSDALMRYAGRNAPAVDAAPGSEKRRKLDPTASSSAITDASPRSVGRSSAKNAEIIAFLQSPVPERVALLSAPSRGG